MILLESASILVLTEHCSGIGTQVETCRPGPRTRLDALKQFESNAFDIELLAIASEPPGTCGTVESSAPANLFVAIAQK